MPPYRPVAGERRARGGAGRHTPAGMAASASGRDEGPDRMVGPFVCGVGQTDLWVMRPYSTIRIAATMAPRISGIHAMPDEFE